MKVFLLFFKNKIAIKTKNRVTVKMIYIWGLQFHEKEKNPIKISHTDLRLYHAIFIYAK